ncbi:MAG: adenosylcobinamide-phosphate synthase CbiB [Halomonas sp.]|nr:adenosylcobinamide-phosphate synthase CbiB [Halomonas sp.]MDN6296489.1 adenosylcobinamide-phosphate synthase CbiB [Halomonas sp.]MDN6313842.1 adenosylcobinamide-phosphate synthase CbiB [Halomonas sp.]MDN6335296.1 adenosylcobinamide-phosphate synthase CbiB [Halomonas sp.]
MMPGVALIALTAAAIAVDLAVGDPRRFPHPVVLMGRLISALEARLNHGSARARRWGGLLTVLVTVLGTFVGVWLVCRGLGAIHPWLGLVAELWLISTAVAIKGLGDAGRAVAAPLKQGDLPAARAALSMVVGRDTQTLNEADIARGAVETVAENTSDGITAPLLFALVGGAPLALAYKAVNTLDSMIGYRTPRYADFGRAAAKLDDAANWLPARLTALCFCLSGKGIDTAAWQGTRRDAPRHASPNAGWPEAAMAHRLGVALGGASSYQGVMTRSATLGEPRETLNAGHIDRAIALMHQGWARFFALTAALVIASAWLIKAGGTG